MCYLILKLTELGANGSDLETAMNLIDLVDVQLDFSIPFDWTIEALCIYLGDWLASGSNLVPMSFVGLFSSSKFTTLVLPLLGQEFAQNLTRLVHASSIKYLEEDAEEGGKSFLAYLANNAGARLLPILEKAVSPKRLAECSVDKLGALSVAIIGILIATRYLERPVGEHDLDGDKGTGISRNSQSEKTMTNSSVI